MAETIRYEAKSLGLYELDGKLCLSMVGIGGEHVIIEIGPKQAAMIAPKAVDYVSSTFVGQFKN